MAPAALDWAERGPTTTTASAFAVNWESTVMRGVSEAVSRSRSAVADGPSVVSVLARPSPRMPLASLETG